MEIEIDKRYRFMIHLRGAFYSNELYDKEGKWIFDLERAIERAEVLYPDDEWEVYNGELGYNNYGEEIDG